MGKQQLTLEVLNGPLDGAEIEITEETEWSRSGSGPLTFPWDTELGEPQARFTVDDQGWWLEGIESRHGTYLVRESEPERVEEKRPLEEGDMLRASSTWLWAIHIE